MHLLEKIGVLFAEGFRLLAEELSYAYVVL
jgi:hypothetical protein